MNSYESLFVGITQKKGADIVVGVIYRPPGENLADFNKEIDMLLDTLSKTHKEILLLGDFNVNLLKSQDHFLTNSFLNSMISHHYLPAILRPNRINDDLIGHFGMILSQMD